MLLLLNRPPSCTHNTHTPTLSHIPAAPSPNHLPTAVAPSHIQGTLKSFGFNPGWFLYFTCRKIAIADLTTPITTHKDRKIPVDGRFISCPPNLTATCPTTRISREPTKARRVSYMEPRISKMSLHRQTRHGPASQDRPSHVDSTSTFPLLPCTCKNLAQLPRRSPQPARGCIHIQARSPLEE